MCLHPRKGVLGKLWDGSHFLWASMDSVNENVYVHLPNFFIRGVEEVPQLSYLVQLLLIFYIYNHTLVEGNFW